KPSVNHADGTDWGATIRTHPSRSRVGTNCPAAFREFLADGFGNPHGREELEQPIQLADAVKVQDGRRVADDLSHGRLPGREARLRTEIPCTGRDWRGTPRATSLPTRQPGPRSTGRARTA